MSLNLIKKTIIRNIKVIKHGKQISYRMNNKIQIPIVPFFKQRI